MVNSSPMACEYVNRHRTGLALGAYILVRYDDARPQCTRTRPPSLTLRPPRSGTLVRWQPTTKGSWSWRLVLPRPALADSGGQPAELWYGEYLAANPDARARFYDETGLERPRGVRTLLAVGG
jgi:hypothetical protein